MKKKKNKKGDGECVTRRASSSRTTNGVNGDIKEWEEESRDGKKEMDLPAQQVPRSHPSFGCAAAAVVACVC